PRSRAHNVTRRAAGPAGSARAARLRGRARARGPGRGHAAPAEQAARRVRLAEGARRRAAAPAGEAAARGRGGAVAGRGQRVPLRRDRRGRQGVHRVDTGAVGVVPVFDGPARSLGALAIELETEPWPPEPERLQWHHISVAGLVGDAIAEVFY